MYRVQLGLTFRPTPRGTPTESILGEVSECRLALELFDMDGLQVGWEGGRWHIRYAEGAAFDGSCVVGPGCPIDDVRDDGLRVSHPGGVAELAWTAVWDFAAFVNRYVALGPELLILAGWPLGPALRRGADGPELDVFGAPAGDGEIWASHGTLGRVECTIGHGR